MLAIAQQRNREATQSQAETNAALHIAQARIQDACSRKKNINRKYDTLRKRQARSTLSAESTPPPTTNVTDQLALKDQSGTIRLEVRDLLRQLAVEGVGTKHIMNVITHVLNTFGFEVVDSISPRSISRVLLEPEGLLQSQIQIAHEISETQCKSYLHVCISFVLK